jgi:muramoyltetrapeptide carboxypeptidase LdcA involved in peptidoglycan recycling
VPRLSKPHAVRAGDCIAIAAPGFAVDEARLEAGAARLRAAGFRVCWRPDLLAQQGYLAGPDARRAAELLQWLEDPGVAAILCARGGYGAQRMLSGLDAACVRRARKPLIGFSDVTTLLGWQREVAGLAGVHGPMCVRDDGAFHGKCGDWSREWADAFVTRSPQSLVLTVGTHHKDDAPNIATSISNVFLEDTGSRSGNRKRQIPFRR